jgi:hypothetical protein
MNDSILLAYAKAMWAAQKLESSLKLLFSLLNIISGTSKAQAPLTDEEFKKLLTVSPKDKRPIDKLTMGGAKRSLLEMLPDLGLSPFPENAKKALSKTIDVRNFLAHHYFIARAPLINYPDASQTLTDELDSWSEVFNEWLPTLDRWSDMLMKAMGYTDDDMKELQNIVDEGPPTDVLEEASLNMWSYRA